MSTRAYGQPDRPFANALVVLGTSFVVPGYEKKIWVSLDYSNLAVSYVQGLTANNGDTAVMQRRGSTWLVTGIIPQPTG